MTRLSPEQKKDVCECYKQGMGCKKLVEKFDITIPTLYNILNANKIPSNRKVGEKKGRYRIKFPLQEAYQEYLKGAKLKELGKKYKVPYILIHGRFSKHNLPLRLHIKRKNKSEELP